MCLHKGHRPPSHTRRVSDLPGGDSTNKAQLVRPKHLHACTKQSVQNRAQNKGSPKVPPRIPNGSTYCRIPGTLRPCSRGANQHSINTVCSHSHGQINTLVTALNNAHVAPYKHYVRLALGVTVYGVRSAQEKDSSINCM